MPALDLVSVFRKMTWSKSTPQILDLEEFNTMDSKAGGGEFWGIYCLRGGDGVKDRGGKGVK